MRFLAAVTLFVPFVLGAQAPVITPAGDPSIQADTIYKLAVDPAKYPDDAVIYLLDDGVARYDATGRGTRTFRQIIQILKPTAVAAFAERRLGYAPDHQKFTLNWARVVKPTGEVISDKPAQMQESDVAAATANPVYVNAKQIRLSLGGVAVGTLIDISYTTEETQPYHEADAYIHWNIHAAGAIPVLRSRFVYDIPASVRPALTERNLDFKPTITETGGRRTYVYARSDVPKYRSEPFAPDTNSVHMFVIASLPTSWAAIGSWYGGLAADRYAVSPAIETKVRELLTSAKTRLDTVRAIHKWVAQDIRYVSVSLGLGGFQPRAPGATMETGFGDCKDKATLFVAVMRKLGLEAYPVLLNLSGLAVRKDHPSIRQFNHVIAAVPNGSDFVFTDLTAAPTPYGELPTAEHGGFAVVVLADGKSREVVLPRAGPGARKIETKIIATMDTTGALTGYLDELNTGIGFEARRIAFGVPLDSARKAVLMRGLLAPIPGARGDSMTAFNGRDLYDVPRYRIYFSGAKGTTQTGGLDLFTNPWGVMPGTSRVASLKAMPPRKSSILADAVLGGAANTMVIVTTEITLPEGWRARVPANVVAKSDFGTYITEYSQIGRVFKIVRTEGAGSGIFPPSRMADVIAFFQATAADENNKTIVIDRK